MHLGEHSRAMVYTVDGEPQGELRLEDGREIWPPNVRGWSDVLDCTIEPWLDQSLDDNLRYAARVRKSAVVIRIDAGEVG